MIETLDAVGALTVYYSAELWLRIAAGASRGGASGRASLRVRRVFPERTPGESVGTGAGSSMQVHL